MGAVLSFLVPLMGGLFKGVVDSVGQSKQAENTVDEYEQESENASYQAEKASSDAEHYASQYEDQAEHIESQYNTAVDDLFRRAREDESLIKEQLAMITSRQGVVGAAAGYRTDSGAVQAVRDESQRKANQDINTLWANTKARKKAMYEDMTADRDALLTEAEHTRTGGQETSDYWKDQASFYDDQREKYVNDWNKGFWAFMSGRRINDEGDAVTSMEYHTGLGR